MARGCSEETSSTGALLVERKKTKTGLAVVASPRVRTCVRHPISPSVTDSDDDERSSGVTFLLQILTAGIRPFEIHQRSRAV